MKLLSQNFFHKNEGEDLNCIYILLLLFNNSFRKLLMSSLVLLVILCASCGLVYLLYSEARWVFVLVRCFIHSVHSMDDTRHTAKQASRRIEPALAGFLHLAHIIYSGILKNTGIDYVECLTWSLVADNMTAVDPSEGANGVETKRHGRFLYLKFNNIAVFHDVLLPFCPDQALLACRAVRARLK